MVRRKCQPQLYNKPHTCIYCRRFYAHTGKYLDHLKRHRKQTRQHWYTTHELHTTNNPYKCPSCQHILSSTIAKALNQYSFGDFARTCGNCSRRWEFCLKRRVGVPQPLQAFLHINKKMKKDTMMTHIENEKVYTVDYKKTFTENGEMHRSVTYRLHEGVHTQPQLNIDNEKMHFDKILIDDKKKQIYKKRHKCSICNKAFLNQSALKRHSLVHSNERHHICHHCKRGFKLPYHLREHLRIHTNEKPFKCHVCDQSFAQSSTRNQHVRRHTPSCMEGTSFKCHMCDRCFPQRVMLNSHEKTHHSDKEIIQYYKERPHMCPHCKKGFKQDTDLTQHLKLLSKAIGPIKKRVLPFKCFICNMSFLQSDACAHHVDTHSDKEKRRYYKDRKVICKYCKRGFKLDCNLKRHLRNHTNEKP